MVSIINLKSSARSQLRAFRAATSEVRVASGGPLARLKLRLGVKRAGKGGTVDRAGNVAAWTTLKITLNQTHGRAGLLAMREIHRDQIEGKPLTPDRIKCILARADAYDAAQRLVLIGTREGADGTLAMRAAPPSAAEVHKAVSDLRAACEKAIAANPESARELSPYVVIHSMIKDLPASKVQGLSMHDQLLRYTDETDTENPEDKFKPFEANLNRFDEISALLFQETGKIRIITNRNDVVPYSTDVDESGLSELDRSFVEFVNQKSLQRYLERSQALTKVTQGEYLSEGAFGSVFRATSENGTATLFKPLVHQTLIGNFRAGGHHVADRTWFADGTNFSSHGARSAARAVGSTRVAEMLNFGKVLVEAKFAVATTMEKPKEAATTPAEGAAKTPAEAAKVAEETVETQEEAVKTSEETAKASGEAAETPAETVKTPAEAAKSAAGTVESSEEKKEIRTTISFGIIMPEAKGRKLERSDSAEPHQVVDSVRRDLAGLQMVDWICGQRDRHLHNLRFEAMPDGGYQLRAFDHDDSFITATEAFVPADNSLLAPPPVIDTEMKERLDGVTPEALQHALGNILDKDAIHAAVQRLVAMKTAVVNGSIKVIEPDKWNETIPDIGSASYAHYEFYRSMKGELYSRGIGLSYADLYHATIQGPPPF